MNLLISCCPKTHPTVWSGVIDSIPSLCWGIVALVALFIFFKKLVIPIIDSFQRHTISTKQLQYTHEENLKKESFEHEKFWALFKEIEHPAEELKNELESLRKRTTDLENGEKKLEKDKFEQEKTLLEEKLKIYEEFIKKIGR